MEVGGQYSKQVQYTVSHIPVDKSRGPVRLSLVSISITCSYISGNVADPDADVADPDADVVNPDPERTRSAYGRSAHMRQARLRRHIFVPDHACIWPVNISS